MRRQITLLFFQQLFTLGVGWDFEVSALLTSIPNQRILKGKIYSCGHGGGVRLLEISFLSQKSGVSGPSLEELCVKETSLSDHPEATLSVTLPPPWAVTAGTKALSRWVVPLS